MLDLVTSAHAQEHGPIEGPAESHVNGEVQESVGHPEAEHGGFPPFEPSTYGSQLLWLAISFGFLYWLMQKVAMPRIGGILEERDNRIAGDLAEAARLKAETDAAIAAYEQSLAEARQRAQGIAQAARDRSKAAVDAERAGLEGDLNGRLEEAERRIDGVKSQALANVDAIARDAADALVESLLGGRVPPDELATAVQAAMQEHR